MALLAASDLQVDLFARFVYIWFELCNRGLFSCITSNHLFRPLFALLIRSHQIRKSL